MVREIPIAVVGTVDHDARFGRVCGDGFAIVSRFGVVSEVDGRLRTVGQRDFGAPLGDLSISGERWAWIVAGELRIGEFSAPLAGAPACRWQASGQGLWVANGTGDQVRVELRTPAGEVVRAMTVPDSLGDSMVRLRHHPDTGAVVLWLSAGADGTQSWLVRDDGTATRLPADDCVPAMFGPAGDWLLAAGEAGLVRVSWPDGAKLGTLTWADIDPDAARDGGDAPGDCLMALTDGFVSWSTDNGRLRTIDPVTLSVVDEVALTGVDDVFTYAVPRADGRVLSVHGERTLVLSALRDWSPS